MELSVLVAQMVPRLCELSEEITGKIISQLFSPASLILLFCSCLVLSKCGAPAEQRKETKPVQAAKLLFITLLQIVLYSAVLLVIFSSL